MSKARSSFKEEHPLGAAPLPRPLAGSPRAARLSTDPLGPRPAEKRRAEAARIKEKYPDRIPVSADEVTGAASGSPESFGPQLLTAVDSLPA